MPANSVRALLALIVLVMLATLGSQFFNAMSNQAIEVAPFNDVKASEHRSDQRHGIAAVVLSRSRDDLVSGKIYRPGSSAAAQDLAKNISSALLTLLTAIISFYFGTQAAREGARGVTDAQLRRTSRNHRVAHRTWKQTQPRRCLMETKANWTHWARTRSSNYRTHWRARIERRGKCE